MPISPQYCLSLHSTAYRRILPVSYTSQALLSLPSIAPMLPIYGQLETPNTTHLVVVSYNLKGALVNNAYSKVRQTARITAISLVQITTIPYKPINKARHVYAAKQRSPAAVLCRRCISPPCCVCPVFRRQAPPCCVVVVLCLLCISPSSVAVSCRRRHIQRRYFAVSFAVLCRRRAVSPLYLTATECAAVVVVIYSGNAAKRRDWRCVAG